MGEHVDYNQGLILPAAIDRSIRLAARKRADRLVDVQSFDLNQHACFSLDDLEQKVDIDGKPLPAWALYPAGVAWAFTKEGYTLGGLDVVLVSNLPMGIGLSSSAALELAFGLAWQTAADIQLDRMRLAQLCQIAENRYVGVQCGLMDQFACAHGVARHALLFDTRSLAWQPLPMPPNTAIVIVDTGIRRDLPASVYNQRREACAQAVKLLQSALPGVRALRDVTPEQLNAHSDLLPEEIRKRAQYVVDEITRVQQASLCLVQDDAHGFGRLMVESHRSLRDLYEISFPQLDALVEIAGDIEGWHGGRLTGAGFGGSTVHLVRADKAGHFTEQLKAVARERIGQDVQVAICQPVRGVHLLGA